MKKWIILLVMLWAGNCWGATLDAKIGVATDIHYDSNDAGLNLTEFVTVLGKMLNTEQVSHVFLFGDVIDSVASRADIQSKITAFKAGLSSGGFGSSLIYTITGGHELVNNQSTNNVNLVADFNAVSGAPLYPSQNYYVDVGSNWRVIMIDTNVVGPVGVSRDSADQDTLDYLTAQLTAARIAGKYVMIGSHTFLGQNYPNSGFLITPNYQAVTISASGTTGSVTLTASGDPTPAFSAVMATGNHRVLLKHGATWGKAYITAVNSSTEVVVTVEQDFGNTGNADQWIMMDAAGNNAEGVSAVNAQEIRAIIDAAKAAGASIPLVVSGHAPSTKVTDGGTDYIILKSFYTGVTTLSAFGVVSLYDDGTYAIAGAKSQASYDISDASKLYFIDVANGHDTNESGRLRSSPWKTIAKANVAGTLVAGNTVRVLAGAYTEGLSPNVSGSEGLPVTWIFEHGFASSVSVASALAFSSKSYITVTGEGSATFAGYTAQGVTVTGSGCSNIIVDNIDFIGNGSYGARLDDTSAGVGIAFNRVGFLGSPTSYNIYGLQTAKATFNYCLAYGSAGADIIRIANTANLTFNNCTFVSNASNTYLFEFYNSAYAILKNCALGGTVQALRDLSDADTTVSYSAIQFNQTFSGDLINGGNNQVNTDPLFISTTDYRLRSTSPAINAGVVVTGVHDVAGVTDYAGQDLYNMPAPDIGAYGTVKSTMVLKGGTLR